MQISTYLSQRKELNDDTKCGPRCLGCKKLKNLCDYYESRQEKGIFYYVLNSNEEGELYTWEGSKPFCDFLVPDPCPNLDPIERSHPILLAYVKLYSPPKAYIVEGVNPEFMSFKITGKYFESIDEEKVKENIENSEKKTKKALYKKVKKPELSDLLELAQKIQWEVQQTEYNMYHDSNAPKLTNELIQNIKKIINFDSENEENAGNYDDSDDSADSDDSDDSDNSYDSDPYKYFYIYNLKN
jgi:hypothetical protein